MCIPVKIASDSALKPATDSNLNSANEATVSVRSGTEAQGKIELFSLESLVDMATGAGMKVEVRLKKAA
jgi:hypothetical protein